MTATAVTGLDSDAMRKMADRSRGARSAKDGVPIASTRTSSPRATSVMRPGSSPASMSGSHVTNGM